MSNEEEIKEFWKVIRENWAIAVVVVSLIVSWGNFYTADNTAKERIGKLESEHASLENSNATIQTQLAQIQTDLQWIKVRLK